MSKRTSINDFQPALESIDRLLEKYKDKEDKWLSQGVMSHTSHAVAHGTKLLYAMREMPLETFSFEDLQSFACRALMALEIYLEKNQGPPPKAEKDV